MGDVCRAAVWAARRVGKWSKSTVGKPVIASTAYGERQQGEEVVKEEIYSQGRGGEGINKSYRTSPYLGP